MCVPALGPVPAPEVTPAGSPLAPVFPLHVALWLVSNCVRRPGHTESGLLTRPPVPGTVGKCPAFPPSDTHMLVRGSQSELRL